MAVEIRNLMEDFVMQNLDVVLEGAGCCTCDACRSDVAAWTLNNLKPHYVATRQGRLMVKLQSYELQSRAGATPGTDGSNNGYACGPPERAAPFHYRRNSRSSLSFMGE